MTEQQHLQQRFNPSVLWKEALIGGSIAFVLVAAFMLFLLSMTFSDTVLHFGDIALPIVTVTTAGAFGGVCHYLLNLLLKPHGWVYGVFNIFFAVAYFIGLWMSLIIALALLGHWD